MNQWRSFWCLVIGIAGITVFSLVVVPGMREYTSDPPPPSLTCEQRLAEDAAGIGFSVSRGRRRLVGENQGVRYYESLGDPGRTWVQLELTIGDHRVSAHRDLDLTDLSPSMQDALIAQTKDEMYCSWLKARQDDCRWSAVAESLNAVTRQWAGPYQPAPDLCAEKPEACR